MGFALWLKTNIILVLIVVASVVTVIAVILTQTIRKKHYMRAISKKEEKQSSHQFVKTDSNDNFLTIQPMSDAKNTAAKDIDDILNNL